MLEKSVRFAFRGESRHKIDQKGRVSLPSDFRRGIITGDPDYQPGSHASFTIVYGDNRWKSLKCYTEQAIQEIDEAIASMRMSTQERRFLEFFYQTKSFKAQLDPAGRFIIPKHIKEKTAIKSEVYFAGTGTSFELWNVESFRDHCLNLEQCFRDGGQPEDPLILLDAVF